MTDTTGVAADTSVIRALRKIRMPQTQLNRELGLLIFAFVINASAVALVQLGATGAIDAFRPGIGMIASRLRAPLVPVRIDGLQHVLGVGWRMARPGRVRVAFGAPLNLTGEDYEAIAKTVENAVKAL